MERLTYKSAFGDYGTEKKFDDEWEELCAMRNALGKYEDLGLTPDEIRAFIQIVNETHALESDLINRISKKIDGTIDMLKKIGAIST